MCNSCVKPFHGKYLQQCEICGDPAHEPEHCSHGQPFSYPVTYKSLPQQRNCPCPHIYNSWGMHNFQGNSLE